MDIKYIKKMTETEKKARLHKMGKDIAVMYPGLHGSMSFNYQNGKYMNKNMLNLYIDTSPGQRPTPPVDGGY